MQSNCRTINTDIVPTLKNSSQTPRNN